MLAERMSKSWWGEAMESVSDADDIDRATVAHATLRAIFTFLPGLEAFPATLVKFILRQ